MFVCVKQVGNGPLSTNQGLATCNTHQLQLQNEIPEATSNQLFMSILSASTTFSNDTHRFDKYTSNQV